MSQIDKVWKEFLSSVITDTFDEFLSSEEVESRVTWILSKLYSISAEKLFKNVLFMMNNNSLSRIAIGYKLHFLEDNWQDLFNEPYSEEFDKNDSLNSEDKKLLDEFIENFSIAINHHVELVIAGNNVVKNLFDAIKQLSQFYKLPNYEKMESMYVVDGDLVYNMEFGQILYMVAFDQNPFTGLPCNSDIPKMIKEKYPHRLATMESLKKTWPTGISLKYVKSNKIF